MRVAIVSRGCPSSEYPLYGCFEFEQARGLASCGVDVDYFALDTRSVRNRRDLSRQCFWKDGVNVHLVNIPLGRVPDWMTVELGMRALRKEFGVCYGGKAGAPDVVHAHFAVPGAQALGIAHAWDVPLVYTEHCSLALKADRRYCKLSKRVVEGSDLALAVSQALAGSISKFARADITVVPNLISDLFFSTPLDCPSGDFTFLSVGSLVEGKGHDVLLKAFALADIPGTRLKIIGEGPLSQSLRNLASDLKISDRVDLLGSLFPDQVAEALHSSNVFVLSSRAETFGVVYAEAMAAGRPVIATRCGGPEGFVVPETGMTVSCDDERELAHAMSVMCANFGEYNALEIREYAESRFSSKHISRRLIRLYGDVAR